MGNKFSNRTQVNLRPKVCKSPPPTPHPAPTITTPCCTSGIPDTLRWTISNGLSCAAIAGQTGIAIWQAGSGGWIGQINAPCQTIPFVLKCVPGSPAHWEMQKVNAIQPCMQGNLLQRNPQTTCTPLNIEFLSSIRIGTCPCCDPVLLAFWQIRFVPA